MMSITSHHEMNEQKQNNIGLFKILKIVGSMKST